MVTLLTTVLFSPAHGQDRVTGGRADPAYLEYLGALSALDLLPPPTSPQPELWDGLVGFMAPDRTEIGRIFVGGVMPTKQELWFMPEAPDPGAEFGFVHYGWYEPGTEGTELAAWDAGWDQNPCYNQYVKYKIKPDTTLTAALDYEPNIDRYHFMLLQDGLIVGRMLREHHHVPNMPEKLVEHWGFYDLYAFPDQVGEELWVALAPVQYDTTTEFFDALNLDADIWLGFAQVQYQEKLGYQCLGDISF